MAKIVALTFDVEQDCPPFAETRKGMEYGLPRVMNLLEEYGIRGTFLFTGRMAQEFPELARRAAKRHELGCHGLEHERFDRLPPGEVRERLLKAKEILSRFGEVVSFRAPNFQFPGEYYPILSQVGFRVDSTKAKHKGWKGGVTRIGEIIEIPATTTSIVTRLPWKLQERLHGKFESPVVYIFHPWEFVDMSRKLRPDCWFGTGRGALENLRRLIEFHLNSGSTFLTLREIGERMGKTKTSND
jgi:peptidoglycan/xylan/chitin deacetylase (PgdA/CDA1 family)